MRIFINDLTILIKKYKFKGVTELISSNKKDVLDYLEKVCQEYNRELSINPIFEQAEASYNEEVETIGSKNTNKKKKDKSLKILERILNDIILTSHQEIIELFADNQLNHSDKNLYININNQIANGEILVEEETKIYRNGYETKQESKITTKKVVGIELNTNVAVNILKRLEKNCKYLKQFSNDYIKAMNSTDVLCDKNSVVKFPSLTFSNQIKKEISKSLKEGNMILNDEYIASFNKQLDLLKKIDSLPLDMLSKMSEIGFNQSKELMTTITADNMMFENKQITLDANKIMEEENLQIENKQKILFNTLQNFNLQEESEETEKN